jgi:phosphoesterase RecJ-like protein
VAGAAILSGSGPLAVPRPRISVTTPHQLSDFPFAPWLLDRVRQAKRMVLMTHVGPDADGLGSQLAFALAARQQGVQVAIVNDEPLPPRYGWLDPEQLVQSYDTAAQALDGADLGLIFDAHEVQRAARPAQHLVAAGVPVWVVDHHPPKPELALQGVIAAKFSSTGELVYELLQALGWPVTQAVAAPIFAAIAFDTGSFRFVRNDPQTFRVAAALLETGLDVAPIQEALFASKPRAEVELLGRVLSEVRFAAEGRVSYALLRPEITAGLALDGDALGEVIPTLINIDGVLAAVLLKPGKTPQEWKLSLRSKDAVTVGHVARIRGGGGHDHAAGATLTGDAENLMKTLVAEVVAAVETQTANPPTA